MTRMTVERLGHHGDGIAAGPVYVSGALPGEVVEGEIEDGKIQTPRIVEPSCSRVRPPCPHAKGCGGCSLQHASDDFVSGWKTELVETALAAHGIDAKVGRVHTSPRQSRRRATLAGRRTKKGVLVGFHGRAQSTILEVPECILLTPALVKSIPALRAMTQIGASRKGEIAFTLTDTETGIDVQVVGGKPLDLSLRTALATIAEEHDLARLTWDDELVAQRRVPEIIIGNARINPPPGAFLQATEDGQHTLVSAMLETVSGAKRVVDLFAGCGTFTLPTAVSAEVHAVEGDAALLHALDAAWRNADGLKKVTTETRDLFRRPLMPDELSAFDAAIIDPPRAGAAAQVDELAKSGIGTIAMISCNPVTFARDTRRLVDAGFELTDLSVIDQFRWSPHVEVAAALHR